MPNHNHAHCCAHRNVRYCTTCQLVHCLDCSKEWRSYAYQPYQYGTWTTPFLGGGGIGQTGGAGNTYQPGTLSSHSMQQNLAASMANTSSDADHHPVQVGACTHKA